MAAKPERASVTKGVSTNGQICYGILLEASVEYPWSGYYGDIDAWYCYDVLGFEHSWMPEAPADQYSQERSDFLETQRSLPVEIVNVCSGNCPTWIIAIPDSVISARRGFPVGFEPMALAEKAILGWNTVLTDFCTLHNIAFEGVPKWYLSSYSQPG